MALPIIKENFYIKDSYFKAAIVVKVYARCPLMLYMHHKFVSRLKAGRQYDAGASVASQALG